MRKRDIEAVARQYAENLRSVRIMLQRAADDLCELHRKVECLVATYADLTAEVRRIAAAVDALEVNPPTPSESVVTQDQLDAVTFDVKAEADRLEALARK